MDETDPTDSTVKWFWLFALGHLLVWFVVPWLTMFNAPLDAVEMLFWGHEWQLGYFKHPPLPAWLAEGTATAFGSPIWPTYLLSQICVVGCFWAAWKFAREVLAPWPALAAAILLESCYYYSFTSPEFNNNMTAKVCWALFTLLLYYGITRSRWYYWLGGGVFLAAAMLSKYDAALLLIAVVAFSFINARARQCWRTPGPYVLIGAAGLLFSPHLWWLVSNDYPTLQYLAERSSSESHWYHHLIYPLRFLGIQLAAVGLMAGLSTAVLGWRWRIKEVDDQATFHRSYLTCVVLGPMLVAMLFSLCTGARLRSMWGASMFTYAPVLLFCWFQARPEVARYRHVIASSIATGLIFAFVVGGTNLLSSHFQDHPSRGDFPGREVTNRVEEAWSTRQIGKLKHVGGDAWIAANVNIYHAERPTVFAEFDAVQSPWVDEEVWSRDGGVVVWDLAIVEEGYVAQLREKFPTAEILAPLELPWQKTPHHKPLRIGMAIVPAAGTVATRVASKPENQRR